MGDAIGSETCNWYVLDFIWEGSDQKYASIKNIPGFFTVKDTDVIRQAIRRLAIKDYEVFLGVHYSAFGDMKSQVETLKQNCKFGPMK